MAGVHNFLLNAKLTWHERLVNIVSPQRACKAVHRGGVCPHRIKDAQSEVVQALPATVLPIDNLHTRQAPRGACKVDLEARLHIPDIIAVAHHS